MMPYTVELIRRKELARDIFELVFTRPHGFDFTPGQYLRFRFDTSERDYTLVSGRDDHRLCLCIKKVLPPGFSARLAGCPMGEVFEVSGPHGFFIHQPGPRPDVFVAAGTGIAPFVAFARAGVNGHILLQGAGNPDQLIYRKLLSGSSRKYVPCLSRAKKGGPEQAFHGRAFQGRVTDYLKTRLPDNDYQFYLCGRRQMILDAVDIIDERFPGSRVFTERFT